MPRESVSSGSGPPAKMETQGLPDGKPSMTCRGNFLGG